MHGTSLFEAMRPGVFVATASWNRGGYPEGDFRLSDAEKF